MNPPPPKRGFDFAPGVTYNYSKIRGGAVADKKRVDTAEEEPKIDAGEIERRFDMMDRRLDNIDSIVSAVVERVMTQPITINLVCPHCGKNVEVALIGNRKPGR